MYNLIFLSFCVISLPHTDHLWLEIFREIKTLESQLETLKKSNKETENTLQHTTVELRKCHEELKHVQAQAAELMEVKRTLEIQNQSQQEKLSLIREHIVLINGTLEEENLAKRFLTVLLDRLDATSPVSFSPQSLHSASPSAFTSPPLLTVTPHATISTSLPIPPPHITSSPPFITSLTNSSSPRMIPSLMRVLPSSLEITLRNNPSSKSS